MTAQVEPVQNLQIFSDNSPFLLPKSEPLHLPYDIPTPAHTHYSTAPVLPNGMVVLGEVGKWATMSFGRVASCYTDKRSVTLELVGTPSEVVTFAYIKSIEEDMTIRNSSYQFPDSCSKELDRHGNEICGIVLRCDPNNGCDFQPIRVESSGVRIG